MWCCTWTNRFVTTVVSISFQCDSFKTTKWYIITVQCRGFWPSLHTKSMLKIACVHMKFFQTHSKKLTWKKLISMYGAAFCSTFCFTLNGVLDLQQRRDFDVGDVIGFVPKCLASVHFLNSLPTLWRKRKKVLTCWLPLKKVNKIRKYQF